MRNKPLTICPYLGVYTKFCFAYILVMPNTKKNKECRTEIKLM